MLQYILAPNQPSQSSLVRGHIPPQRAPLGAQITLAGEGQGLLQKQGHFAPKVSTGSAPSFFWKNLQQSIRGDRLNQECLSCRSGSGISKATAAFKSATNIRAEVLKAWTLLTRSSALRQMRHEGHHQIVRHPDLHISESVLPYVGIYWEYRGGGGGI